MAREFAEILFGLDFGELSNQSHCMLPDEVVFCEIIPRGPISHRLEYMLNMLISLTGLIMGAFGLARSTSHQFRDAGRIDGFGGSPGSAMAAAWRRPASRRPSRRVCGDGGFLEFTTSPWGQETRFCPSLSVGSCSCWIPHEFSPPTGPR